MIQTILNFLARLISEPPGIKSTAWQMMEIATVHSVASPLVKCLRLSYVADSFDQLQSYDTFKREETMHGFKMLKYDVG